MTISILQENASGGGSGASVPISFISNVIAGSSIHAIVKFITATGVTCSDNLNGSYTPLGSLLTDSGAHSATHFYKDNCLGGATTVTFAFSGGSGASVTLAIREIGGTSGFDTHAEQVQNGLGTGTDVVTTGLPSPAISVAPGLCSCTVYATAGTVSQGTNFTLDFQASFALREHLRYTSPTNIAATATLSGASANCIPMAAYFKESTAADAGDYLLHPLFARGPDPRSPYGSASMALSPFQQWIPIPPPTGGSTQPPMVYHRWRHKFIHPSK